MIIELECEAVDQVVQQSLIDHYLMVKKDLKRLKKLQKELELLPYQEEDLAHCKKAKKAFEFLLEYYVGFDWKTVVEAAKAAKKGVK